MFRKNWKERMEKKKWNEMQKYREFKIENFKGVQKFSRFFNFLFNFFRFSVVCIFALLVIGVLIIYVIFVLSLNQMYI